MPSVREWCLILVNKFTWGPTQGSCYWKHQKEFIGALSSTMMKIKVTIYSVFDYVPCTVFNYVCAKLL